MDSREVDAEIIASAMKGEPPRCPKCGERLFCIINDGWAEVNVEDTYKWDKELGAYVYDAGTLGDIEDIHYEHYHCPSCWCELPKELIKKLIHNYNCEVVE